MDIVDMIGKKRDGHEFTREEIRFFIEGYTNGRIPDYQAAAWCMAVYLRGLSFRETTELTLAMAESGEILDLSEGLDFVIDKHSSGGVGDKTSLVVLPLVAACGVPVAKMSGRGLSITGGTLDKMESIDGYNVNLTRLQFVKQAREIGIVLAGQTTELAPADGKLYALRDVTATVSSKGLIASSIMCKKIASGVDGVVLDVKAGAGAFMRTTEDARDLAKIMVNIGTQAGEKVTALVSDMNQPLGNAVGNALEVKEAIETLRGGGPPDLVQHCIEIAGHMLRLAGRSTARDLSDIRPVIEEKLANGEGLQMFRKLVRAQGGDVSQVDNPDKLPCAPVVEEVRAPQSGYIRGINAREVGIAVLHLGAGRLAKGEAIDHAVGAVVHHKVGERVEKDEPLFTVHARTREAAQAATDRILAAHGWSERPGMPLFYDVIFGSD